MGQPFMVPPPHPPPYGAASPGPGFPSSGSSAPTPSSKALAPHLSRDAYVALLSGLSAPRPHPAEVQGFSL